MAVESDTIPICGKRYLTMEQLCTYLSVTKWTIYRLIEQRDIPFAAIGKRSYRFDQERIDKWVAERTKKTVKDI